MKDEYIEAWAEEEGGKQDDPVVSAVKAARQADADEYANAFKNDAFDKPAAEEDEDEEKRKKKAEQGEAA